MDGGASNNVANVYVTATAFASKLRLKTEGGKKIRAAASVYRHLSLTEEKLGFKYKGCCFTDG